MSLAYAIRAIAGRAATSNREVLLTITGRTFGSQYEWIFSARLLTRSVALNEEVIGERSQYGKRTRPPRWEKLGGRFYDHREVSLPKLARRIVSHDKANEVKLVDCCEPVNSVFENIFAADIKIVPPLQFLRSV